MVKEEEDDREIQSWGIQRKKCLSSYEIRKSQIESKK